MDKNFILRCPGCRYTMFTSGIKSDLEEQGLLQREVKKCTNCGGPRKFKCIKCGTITKAIRLPKNKK